MQPAQKMDKTSLGPYRVKLIYMALLAKETLAAYPIAVKDYLTEAIHKERDTVNHACSVALNSRTRNDLESRLPPELVEMISGNRIPPLMSELIYNTGKIKVLPEEDIKKYEDFLNSRYEKAVSVIKIIERYNPTLRDTHKEIIAEHTRLSAGLRLLGLGISEACVKTLTGLDIVEHVNGNIIPPQIGKFIPADLDKSEIKRRKNLAGSIKKKVGKHKSADANDQKKAKLSFQKKLAVLTLYCRGYSLGEANRLLGVEPEPVETPLFKVRTDHSVPEKFDPTSSYILGAYLASSIVYTVENGVAFRSTSKEKLESLSRKLKQSFNLDLKVREETDRFIIDVNRDEFTRDFHQFARISQPQNPLIPVEILESKELSLEFLRGYFEYVKGSLNPNSKRYGITKVNQDNLVKGIAIALYNNGIYPAVAFSSEGRADLYLNDSHELIKLFNLFPDLGEESKRKELLAKLDPECRPMFTFMEYKAISGKLNSATSDSELDVIIKESVDREIVIVYTVKKTVRQWQTGHIPAVAIRGSKIEGYKAELYPTLK